MREKGKSSVAKLLYYAGGHKRLTVLGCTLSGIAAVLSMAPYICIWYVVRGVFAAMPDYRQAGDLVRYGWYALWFALGSAAIYFAALMCTHLAAFRTAKNMRKAAAKHLLDVPLGYLNVSQSGKLRKQIDDNAGMTEQMLAHELPDLVGAVVTPVAAIILLFVFDWRMGLLCFIPLVLAVYLLTRMMGGKNARFFSTYQKAIEDLSAEATEYVRGIPVVKVFQQTVYSFKSFYGAIMRYSKLATDYAMSCGRPMTAFTAVLNGTFLLLIPAGMLLCGAASNGWAVLVDLVFYILFTPLCAMMMTRIMYASQAVMEADEAVRKLGQIMEVEPLPEDIRPQSTTGCDIELKDVTFTYPGAKSPALKNVCFQVPAGKTVALVGPSGGGKSTVASLIPRFWDAGQGKVLIGGVDVRNMAGHDLMDKVAFVFQDTHLFKDSLLENIRAARPDATRQQVLAAAHAAQCDDILSKMPQGLDTVVGTKGVYLSGGEQQRIALARAILKDAPIIVLDEATAFADPENELLIQKAFEKLTAGKTVLMIAHRLSTVQDADNILVLCDGAVAERGTHRELLQQQGLYAAMWRDYQTSARWKVGKEASAV
ncbi:Lipid A export ATP-binding/permease protein MsbA [Anaerotruncus sp. 2789STDY5834896]|uniref:Lipid A export ATP-binding/permease protein MsbA n=1 Tax=uncultured Anaerotruncus sp. TaxID=905011 RepID=A0A1C6GP37_9FIRM|nr:Lipid A export ATP-binding/permease protein MsbA [uncultured Anaerotruncus sp.]